MSLNAKSLGLAMAAAVKATDKSSKAKYILLAQSLIDHIKNFIELNIDNETLESFLEDRDNNKVKSKKKVKVKIK